MDQESAIEGNGNVVQEKRKVAQFDRVEFDGIGKVRFIKGDGPLLVRTDSNLLSAVITDVDDGTLDIDLKGSVSEVSEMVIKVPVKKGQLKGIESDGTGDMKSEVPLKGDKLKVSHDATGNMELSFDYGKVEYLTDGTGNSKLSGTVDQLRIRNSGTGTVKAFDLKPKDVECKSDGTGDIKLHASGTLKVSLTGTGDVIYQGKPEVEDADIEGTGELHKR